MGESDTGIADDKMFVDWSESWPVGWLGGGQVDDGIMGSEG